MQRMQPLRAPGSLFGLTVSQLSRTSVRAAYAAFSGSYAQRGTQESNLTLQFWRPSRTRRLPSVCGPKRGEVTVEVTENLATHGRWAAPPARAGQIAAVLAASARAWRRGNDWCLAYPELVDEGSDCGYVLVVADALGDEVGFGFGDCRNPRCEVGDLAVGACP